MSQDTETQRRLLGRRAHNLLAHLEYAREIRPGQWRAKCPAHAGKSDDSLSLAETAEGTVLLQCFGGCDTRAIVEAVGLNLADLFPARDLTREERRDYGRKQRKRAVRLALRQELLVLAQCNEAHIKCSPIEDPDAAERERLAVRRIRNGLEALYGRR